MSDGSRGRSFTDDSSSLASVSSHQVHVVSHQDHASKSPERTRVQSPGPYGRRDDLPCPRTPSNGPADSRREGFQGRRPQSAGPRYERPLPQDNREVASDLINTRGSRGKNSPHDVSEPSMSG